MVKVSLVGKCPLAIQLMTFKRPGVDVMRHKVHVPATGVSTFMLGGNAPIPSAGRIPVGIGRSVTDIWCCADWTLVVKNHADGTLA